MYSWKDLLRGMIGLTLMMSILGGLMVLNGLHYAGVL